MTKAGCPRLIFARHKRRRQPIVKAAAPHPAPSPFCAQRCSQFPASSILRPDGFRDTGGAKRLGAPDEGLSSPRLPCGSLASFFS